ncbi:HTH-type transcriptional activator RhaR [Eubacterium plexicaudatum ASF492]|uniref:Stage 0 sporulation protein A homolog n=1 Tax=Eubacterium plexicaudatum ASF492 TaxID=1235802 RepID=N2ATL4_9FIRM|nr:HTH-type transcriptional activator RhaR [Eubacterium plexicaudatum ASF492]
MYKVLLVDDEILVREAISAKIRWKELGFELAGLCENGQQAISYIQDSPVDVVLTDIYMPYMDGMGLSKYLYENCPQTEIIIFSGYGEFEYAKQALQYHVSEYILKPVTAKELSKVLLTVREKLDSVRRQEQKLDQLNEVYHKYTKNESLIVSKALSRLVSGTQGIQKCLKELDELGVHIRGNAFRVVAVDLDVYSGYCEIEKELKKGSALMSFVVENISDEILRRSECGIAYRDSDNRICLLIWKHAKQENTKYILEICTEIQDNVYQAAHLSISMGIGCCVTALEDLPYSYESASDMLRYRYTKGTGIILDSGDKQCEANPMTLKKELKAADEAVKSFDHNKFEQTLDRIETWMKTKYVNRNAAAAYFQQMVQLIYANVYQSDEKFAMPETVMAKVADAHSIEAAMEAVRVYAEKGFSALEKIGQSSSKRQADKAMDYIFENYADRNLGLNQLCEYLNMSTSRFSSIFKEATGQTFTEALMNIRIQNAERLLRQTSLKNYEIAEKVGFSDPHYFSIVFKKVTGKTPKEYARENSE